MKTTSRFALAAAAGFFVGSLAISPAQAADLGGDCCADLEERVAELEATTVRKGNRVVSVQLYGQVNQALLIWDDGVDSDAYIVDGDYSSSRFGLRGSAMMKPGWTAGFRVEFEFQSAASNSVSATDDDDGNGAPSLRRASWYIESQQLGRVTMGQTSPATDDLTLISLGGAMDDSSNYYSGGFALRLGVDPDGDVGEFSDLTWSDLAPGADSSRGNFIRYDSPALYGFVLSAAWGENDVADVALRFSKEWNSIRVAAAVGYYWNGERVIDDEEVQADQEKFVYAASVMHVPSGLWLTIQGATEEFGDPLTRVVPIGGADEPFTSERDAQFYYIYGGITKNFTGHGNSTFYVGYGNYEDYGVGLVGDFDGGTADADDFATGTDVDRYSIGVVQKFDSAALEIYAAGNYYEGDVSHIDAGPTTGLGDNNVRSIDVDEWWGVAIGSRIKF